MVMLTTRVQNTVIKTVIRIVGAFVKRLKIPRAAVISANVPNTNTTRKGVNLYENNERFIAYVCG